MHRCTALFATAITASTATADFVGWTMTIRPVDGGALVNVFAVVTSSSDVLLNVYSGSQGAVKTCIPGFLHGAGLQATFQPAGNQSWKTPDSFLTLGGGFSTATGNWTASADTVLQLADGPVNAVPAGAGWFRQSGSPARSLSSVGAIRTASSSEAAASATLGMLVAQFFVAEPVVDWRNMGASVKNQVTGVITQGVYSLGPITCCDFDQDGVLDGCDDCPTVPGSCDTGCPPETCGTCLPCPCPGDFNGDRNIGGEDLGLLLSAWGPCPNNAAPCAADIDGSGIVDGADLGAILSSWGACD